MTLISTTATATEGEPGRQAPSAPRANGSELARVTQRVLTLNAALVETKTRVAELETALALSREHLDESRQTVATIHASRGWRVLTWCYRFQRLVIPAGSVRRRMVASMVRGAKKVKRMVKRTGTPSVRVSLESKPSSGAGAESLVGRETSSQQDYARWILVSEPSAAHLVSQRDTRLLVEPKISLLVDAGESDCPFLRALLESLSRQSYRHWEVCLTGVEGRSETITRVLADANVDSARARVLLLPAGLTAAERHGAALAAATGDYVAVVRSEDTLAPFALYEIATAVNRVGPVDIFYSDEDTLSVAGDDRTDPVFKQEWSPETLRSHNYIGDLAVLSRELVQRVGAFRRELGSPFRYDLILRASEKARAITRVPQVLYHRRAPTRLAGSDKALDASQRDTDRKAIQDHLERVGIDGIVENGPRPGFFKPIDSARARPRLTPETDTLKVVHSGNIGDMIWHLPSIVWLTRHYGLRKAHLYLRTNVPAPYMPGIKHPCKNVMLSESFAASVVPLLKAQPYLDDVTIWRGEAVDIDLDAFRGTGFPLNRGDIGKWVAHAMPCRPKLDEAWLTVPDVEPNEMILVNRTLRAQNPTVSYDFVRDLPNVHFIGLREEYEAFRAQVDVPWLETPTFMDLARAIGGCRLFLGNQSASFVLAQAQLVPRVVELWPMAPNNFAHGPHGFEAWSQPVLEEAVRILLAEPRRSLSLCA